MGCSLGVGALPVAREHILQMVDGIEACRIPHHSVGGHDGGHVIEMQARAGVGSGDVFLASQHLREFQFHVRLSGAKPHFAHPHVAQRFFSAAGLHLQFVGAASFFSGEGNAPLAEVVGDGICLASVEIHTHFLASVGCALNADGALALQHHAVSVSGRQLKTAIVARQSAKHRLRQNQRPFWIGVQGIGEEVGMAVERRIKVNEPHVVRGGNLADTLLNESVPESRAAVEAWMVVEDRRHETNPYFRLRVGHAEGIDEGTVVGDELIGVVRPVSRVGVVESEVYHNEVGLKVERGAKFRQFHVGVVSLSEERGTAVSEVAHFIFVAEHGLQAHRIGIVCPVFKSVAVGDAVTNAGYLKSVASSQGKAEGEAEERKENVFHWL